MLIKRIQARSIVDSRGQKTIEVSVNGQKASSPSGKSTGTYETPPYYHSLSWNINALNALQIPLKISSFSDLKKVEAFLKKKFKLKNAQEFGANALFALESAILKALAKSLKKELWYIINPTAKRLPIPIGNAIGGGLHSLTQTYHTVFQEFLIIPKQTSVRMNVTLMQKIYHQLKSQTHAKRVNDEGAWQTSLDEEAVLKFLSTFKGVRIGIDVAASTFYQQGKYCYQDKTLSGEEHRDYLNYLQKKYNVFYIEDPFNQEDFTAFTHLTKSKNQLIVGDDLTATHLSRIQKAVRMNAINAVIIKPNQNGSLLALEKIFQYCKKHQLKTILSHRSGETLDTAIVDYAFAFQTDFIKCGIATPWRESKLRRLIEIEKKKR